ncbi:MAG: hypothetical protein ACYSU6_05090 [Planctomycetota bacterium]|jgi:hypothetical protein
MVTRKYVRIVILLACGIALVMASSGCKKKEDTGTVKEPNIPPKVDPGSQVPPKVDPGDRVPPKVDPAAAALVEKGIAHRTGKTFVVEPLVGIDKVRFGMTVEEMKKILAEPQNTRGRDNTVTMITCGDRRRADSPLVKNCRCRTKKGIGIGSSKEDIIKAYGEPSLTQPTRDNAVTLSYDQLNSDFMLRDDKVTYMMFRAETFRLPRMPMPRPR